MTRVVRNAALFCAAGILVASAALANVPDPAHSSVGLGRLTLEGTLSDGVTPDPCISGRCGDLLVEVRDFANNVIAGSIVIIDFTNCSDLNLSCDQLTAQTGQTNLAGQKVSGTTNALGQFTFKVQGAGLNNAALGTVGVNPAGTNAGTPCATVYADGVPIGNLRVAAYNLDRSGSGLGVSGGVSSVDVSKGKQESLNITLFGQVAKARDDYDFNGSVTVTDVANLTQFSGDSAGNTGSYNDMHTGYRTWPSGGTPAGFCP